MVTSEYSGFRHRAAGPVSARLLRAGVPDVAAAAAAVSATGVALAAVVTADMRPRPIRRAASERRRGDVWITRAAVGGAR